MRFNAVTCAWMAASDVRAAWTVFSPRSSASRTSSAASRRALSFISSVTRCVVTSVSCRTRSRSSTLRARSSMAWSCSLRSWFSFSRVS